MILSELYNQHFSKTILICTNVVERYDFDECIIWFIGRFSIVKVDNLANTKSRPKKVRLREKSRQKVKKISSQSMS